MKKFRIGLNTVLTVWLPTGILLLNGCGKKEDDSVKLNGKIQSVISADIIIIFLCVLCIIYVITVSNRFKRLHIKIREAQADIEVALIKRYDVLNQSLDAIKGYTEHEEKLMLSLIKARSGMTVAQTQEVLNNQEQVLRSIRMVGEAYPQLYSGELYKNLQQQITETNEHLSASKRLYHANVSLYNQAIAVFPASIIAGMTGNHPAEFLKEDNLEEKREIHL